MTPRERARKLAKDMVRAYEVCATMKDLDNCVHAWTVLSEQAITAAVEEAEARATAHLNAAQAGFDRRERDIAAAIEEEREACAKIAYEKSDRVESDNQVGWGMRSIADSIGTAIRARSSASVRSASPAATTTDAEAP